ncbi:hypothetical protein GGR51DRAFT_577167 [Nemania sp. FL0031]|nr:hypothetical protein GGR51DRAFT_577167 [Nemania sp. FL0031]
MLSDSREAFWNAIDAYPWVSSLANILPLSALLDFLDIPRTLHAYELNGTAPLWCWPITPAGSRLILSRHTTEDVCCLDRFGASPSLICLDGRWGDVYNAANPETLRSCLAMTSVVAITNDILNTAQNATRIQKLTVVRVSRLPQYSTGQRQQYSWPFISASALGWIVLLGLLIFSGLMHCWLSLAFLIVVPATGAVISLSRGGKPRELRPDPPDIYNRIVVAAPHMNESEWLVFYGESVLINSLLNNRLRPNRLFNTHSWIYNSTLRVLILGQWALAIGAAALQGWDAYLITFWILLCILSHTFAFSLERCVADWATRAARFRFERFETLLNGRRALLNTVMALNPDTFAFDQTTKQEKYEELYEGGLLWIDPILKRGADRATWEEATRRAMVYAKQRSSSGNSDVKVAISQIEDGKWEKDYKAYYWCSSILEGVNTAEKVAKRADLSGRFVVNDVD